MVAMSSLPCPFCPFSDPSLYFLAQHVETIHPETDEPSFVSRHFLEEDEPDDAGLKETTTTQDAPSQDYFECECGEAVLLSEFDDHVQLHSAEAADMAVDTAPLPEGLTLSPPHERATWPSATSPLRLVDLNSMPAADIAKNPPSHCQETRQSKEKHVSRSNINKHHHTAKEWIDLLLGPSASSSRPQSHTTHPKDVKRLGVSGN